MKKVLNISCKDETQYKKVKRSLEFLRFKMDTVSAEVIIKLAKEKGFKED